MSRGRVRNSAWMLGGQLVGKGAFFASLMIYSRCLGDAEFGRLVFSVALGVFVLFISDMGATLVTTRRIAASQATAASALGDAIQLRAFLASTAYLLLIAFGLLSGYSTGQIYLLAMVGAGVVLEGFSETYFAAFRATETMQPEGIARLTEGIVCLGMAVTVALAGLGVEWAGFAYALRSAASLAVCMVCARSCSIVPAFGSDRSKLTGLLRESLPLGVMGLLLVSTQRLDNLLVMNNCGEAAVGSYQRCYRIYEALILVVAPTLLPGALFPDLCRAVRRSPESARALIGNMTEVFLAISALACIPLLAAGLDLPRLVWGPGFLGGVQVDRILWTYRIFILAIPVTYMFHVFLATVLALDRQSIVLPVFAAAVLLQMAGNLALIPRFGLPAAASMQFMTVFFSTTLMWWKVRGFLSGTGASAGLGRLIPSAALGSLAGFAPPLPVPVRMVLGAGVFAVSWLAMGGRRRVADLFGSSRQGEREPGLQYLD